VLAQANRDVLCIGIALVTGRPKTKGHNAALTQNYNVLLLPTMRSARCSTSSSE
jgi:hypothetical protein